MSGLYITYWIIAAAIAGYVSWQTGDDLEICDIVWSVYVGAVWPFWLATGCVAFILSAIRDKVAKRESKRAVEKQRFDPFK